MEGRIWHGYQFAVYSLQTQRWDSFYELQTNNYQLNSDKVWL